MNVVKQVEEGKLLRGLHGVRGEIEGLRRKKDGKFRRSL